MFDLGVDHENDDFSFLAGTQPNPNLLNDGVVHRLQQILKPYTPLFEQPVLIAKQHWHKVFQKPEFQAIGHAPRREDGRWMPYRFLITEEEFDWIYNQNEEESIPPPQVSTRIAAVITVDADTNEEDITLLRAQQHNKNHAIEDISSNSTSFSSVLASFMLLSIAAIGGIVLGESRRRQDKK